MISINIPPNIRCENFLETMRELVDTGVKSIEFTVRSYGKKELLLCTNIIEKADGVQDYQVILLNDFIRFMLKEQLSVQIVLNFDESHLEIIAHSIVQNWEVFPRIRYAGQLEPTYFSLWDRLRVYYNVENCLPNYYQLEIIKKAHFDVVHYFLRKHRVKTLRVHARGVTDGIICWSDENDVKLSVYGVNTMEEAEKLREKGVNYITVTDADLFLKQLFHEEMAESSLED